MADHKNYSELLESLREERNDSLESAAELFTGDMRESLGELSLIDNHPADVATEVYERSRDVAQHDRLMHKVEAIDAALERFHQGVYGVCERCGKEIPQERLEILPSTALCTECSSQEERAEQHSLHREPVENEILNRPFARTFNDDRDQTGFDGEDSWQAAARYGTSDSGQDLGTNRDISDPNEIY